MGVPSPDPRQTPVRRAQPASSPPPPVARPAEARPAKRQREEPATQSDADVVTQQRQPQIAAAAGPAARGLRRSGRERNVWLRQPSDTPATWGEAAALGLRRGNGGLQLDQSHVHLFVENAVGAMLRTHDLCGAGPMTWHAPGLEACGCRLTLLTLLLTAP